MREIANGSKICYFLFAKKYEKEKEVYDNIRAGLENMHRSYTEEQKGDITEIIDNFNNHYILCPLTERNVKNMKCNEVIATSKNAYYIKQIMPRENYDVIREILY